MTNRRAMALNEKQVEQIESEIAKRLGISVATLHACGLRYFPKTLKSQQTPIDA